MEYLAVFKEFRNRGYGTHILIELKEMFKDYSGILGDIEDKEHYKNKEDYLIKERRENFYTRNNFIITDKKLCMWKVYLKLIFLPIKSMIDSQKLIDSFYKFYIKVYGTEELSKNAKILN
jgi:GNAT superfamily N-acetyltransferase